MRLVNGWAIPKRSDDLIIKRLKEEDYETHQLALVKEYVKPSHRVLEGGSGIGFVTRALTDISGCVVSSEANPELHACATYNAPKATVLLGALSPRGGYVKPHTGEAFGAKEVDSPLPLDPDDYVELYSLNALVLDIEGMESDVLLAMRLEPLRLIIVEWHPELTGSIPLAKAQARLTENGFRVAQNIQDGDLAHMAWVKS